MTLVIGKSGILLLIRGLVFAPKMVLQMEKIRFKTNDPNSREFAREVRGRVRSWFKENRISTFGNSRMYIKTVIMLSFYVLSFVALLTFSMPPLATIGLAVLMGIGEAGIGMSVMHDAAHGSYSEKKWVNRLFSSTMFILGSNTINWRIQHNVRHHTYTNIYNYDPDISTKAVIRLSEHAGLHRYNRYQHIYAFFLYGLMTLLKFFTDIFTLVEYNREGATRELKARPAWEVFKLSLTKVLYLGIVFGLPLMLTDYSFWQILLAFSVMHITAGIIMSTVFQMAHVVEGTYQPKPDRENMIESDWIVHEMKSTSDFGRRNGLLSWYIGGLDFQIEHHLFPHISHVHYPKIAPIVEQTAKEFGITYNLKPSFRQALISHYRRLKELGRLSPESPMAGVAA